MSRKRRIETKINNLEEVNIKTFLEFLGRTTSKEEMKKIELKISKFLNDLLKKYAARDPRIKNIRPGQKMKYVQCAKCPWKTSTDPHEIPSGYSAKKHRALKKTIANPGELHFGAIRAFACHESEPGKERECAGWLSHQLGPGNNIGLRMKMMREKFTIELDGDQHETFEDTLP